MGIDPDVVPQLFTMFFQTNEPPKGAKTGLGVGLAVAKVLVGTARRYDRGAQRGERKRCGVHRKAADGREYDRSLSAASQEGAGGGRQPDHLALLAELLRGRGYNVIEANDASEALRLVSHQEPDACVIDIGLPGMDGYELARKVTRNTSDPRVPADRRYWLWHKIR